MDKLEQPQNKNFKIITEYVPATEKLYSAPFVDRDFKDLTVIVFGNTGLRLSLDQKAKECSFDFMPENKMEHYEKEQTKYATMLCSGLLEFHNLLNSESKLNEMGSDFSGVKYVDASTNSKLIDAMVNLFSKSDTKDLLTIDGSVIDIDIQKFKDLKSDDPLIKYLDAVVKRGENLIVNYYKNPKYSEQI